MITKISEILDLSPDLIKDWAKNFEIDLENYEKNKNCNPEDFIDFFKKVRNFIASGYNITLIQNILSYEIKYLKSKLYVCASKNIIIDLCDENSQQSDANKFNAEKVINSINNATKEVVSSSNQIDIMILFEMMIKELKQYTERIINAEKKIFLLEDTERRVKEDYIEVSSEIKHLNALIEEKNKKIQDYEEQRKRINLLETQLRLIQLNNQRKKKFWQFWK